MAAHLIESLFVTGYGTAAASGFAFFYQPNTLTPVTVYSDDAAATVVTQPVRLDAAGKSSVPIYLIAPARAIIQNASGATLADIARIDGTRAELAALANPLWPGSASLNALATALATSLGGTDGNFKASGSGAIQRSVQSKLSDAISVKDFAAKGDGTTDDTAAFVSAIAAAAALGGGTGVVVPGGIYVISQALSITSSIGFKGTGRAVSVLKNTNAAGSVFSMSGGVSVTLQLEDISITHSSTSNVAAIASAMTGGFSASTRMTRVDIANHRKGIFPSSGGAGSAILSDCAITCDSDAAAVCIDGSTIGMTVFAVNSTFGPGAFSGTGIYGIPIMIGGSLTGAVGIDVPSGAAIAIGTTNNASTAYKSTTGNGTVYHYGQGALGGTILSGMYADPTAGFWTAGYTGASTTLAITSAYTPTNSANNGHHVKATGAGTTITVNAPTVTPGLTGQTLSFFFENQSGGAVTWAFNAIYRIAAVAPATGTGIGVVVQYNTSLSKWIEISRGSAA